jgi:hypothetical protein
MRLSISIKPEDEAYGIENCKRKPTKNRKENGKRIKQEEKEMEMI